MAVEVKSTWRSMSAVVLTLLLTLSGCGG